jgi:1-deoxy-D-xylulose-5-phosphate reductoisomerase
MNGHRASASPAATAAQRPEAMPARQRIAVLGATGSVGESTLDVISRHPDRFVVTALVARRNAARLAELCRRFMPRYAALQDPHAARDLEGLLAGTGVEVLCGDDDIASLAAANDVDTVLAGIVGAAGLVATLAAARAGKRILLANKEALVMGGPHFMEVVRAGGATLLPIDSEHNAIFQCADRGRGAELGRGVRRIILTASGGPFRTRALETLADVTPDEACAHPNWSMGRKISVDSATMMNKGLEVIEAHWLFGLPRAAIDVVVHPQSVVHSLVEYDDGSILAELGAADMRIPIAHALGHPSRIASGAAPLDLTRIGALAFEAPDLERFPCLALACEALDAGAAAPVVLSAVNEVAVDAFLARRIGFLDIARTCRRALDWRALPDARLTSIDDAIAIDGEARARAAQLLGAGAHAAEGARS